MEKKNILLLPLFGHFNTLTEREREIEREGGRGRSDTRRVKERQGV
jgi:hypothetical protein